jgi:apolipoprotein N-acyltransferase
MRKVTNRLRSVWNGYFIAILPRTVTYTGFHWRLIGASDYDLINIISCSLVSVAFIGFFIALLLQIRRINSKR